MTMPRQLTEREKLLLSKHEGEEADLVQRCEDCKAIYYSKTPNAMGMCPQCFKTELSKYGL